MENFREKLKIQNLFTALGCIILAVVSLLGVLGVLKPIAGDSRWIDFWNGFISGAAWGILLLMVFVLVRNIIAITNEKALKKLYVAENDERRGAIALHAKSAAMSTFLILGIVAVIVAGYFSITASLSILACVLINALLSILFKFYYSSKF